MLAFNGIAVVPFGAGAGVRRRCGSVRRSAVRVDPPPGDKVRKLGSVSVVRDEKSGVDVYVVGCIHGFRSSVRDIETVAGSVTSPLRAVMIELCEDRWRVISKLTKDKSRMVFPTETTHQFESPVQACPNPRKNGSRLLFRWHRVKEIARRELQPVHATPDSCEAWG
mmetsp:Transcript_2417/g.10351  ORF Transcript_2417/g.10351 Transcript_2417/m.10351 type:complete len:167 (+) Transcript_2417:130-630(+)